MSAISQAQEKFGELIQSEFERIERMKQDTEVKDFSKLDKIVVGILPGDGIGPIIMEQAVRVIKALIPDEIASGKVELRHIEGMTIENRAAKLQSLPDDVFEEIKKCDVIIKGPMEPVSHGQTWYLLTACCVAAWSCLLLSVRSVSRTRALTGLSSERILKVNISGEIRVSR